jgi:hypothetical protein
MQMSKCVYTFLFPMLYVGTYLIAQENIHGAGSAFSPSFSLGFQKKQGSALSMSPVFQ